MHYSFLLKLSLNRREINHLVKDHYYYLIFTNTGGLILVFVVCYVIPVTLLLLNYCVIVKYIRRYSNEQLLMSGQRQERDLLLIQTDSYCS